MAGAQAAPQGPEGSPARSALGPTEEVLAGAEQAGGPGSCRGSNSAQELLGPTHPLAQGRAQRALLAWPQPTPAGYSGCSSQAVHRPPSRREQRPCGARRF